MGLHFEGERSHANPMVFDREFFDHRARSFGNDGRDSSSNFTQRHRALQSDARNGKSNSVRRSTFFLFDSRTMKWKILDGNCENKFSVEKNNEKIFLSFRIHGDVLRPPRFEMLFSSLIGSGVQLVVMTFLTLSKKKLLSKSRQNKIHF